MLAQNINLSRFASSMNGRFWHSVSSFHSAPKRLEISELCIFGLSWAILRRWPRDHTMNAFIGRLIWSCCDFNIVCDIFAFTYMHSNTKITLFFSSKIPTEQCNLSPKLRNNRISTIQCSTLCSAKFVTRKRREISRM